MKIVFALLPIVAALLAGYVLGRMVPASIHARLSRLISPLVWGLLFLIGYECGAVVSSARSIGVVLQSAAIFALCTTLAPGLLIFFSKGPRRSTTAAAPRVFRMSLFWLPLRECSIALLMVALGAGLYVLQAELAPDFLVLPSSHLLLWVLIVLVGADLSHFKWAQHGFSASMLMVPVLVVVGSLLGGGLGAWLTGESLRTSLALASGYGWFTLSSVLIGDALGQTYGTLALMTDLLRELLSILVLYALGQHAPRVSIGSAGATALDSTLPVIKQTCAPDVVPLALLSGLLLTLWAPVFITFILS